VTCNLKDEEEIPVQYNTNDHIIKEIDKEMGWIEEDGSSPSKTAHDLGYHCKFMDGPFSATIYRCNTISDTF